MANYTRFPLLGATGPAGPAGATGATGAAGPISSINADVTAVQMLVQGTGIVINDSGATHTISKVACPTTFPVQIFSTSPHALTNDDALVFCDTTHGSITLTLPPAASNPGKTYIIVVESDQPVIVDPDGTDTINDTGVFVVLSSRGAATFFCDGISGWWLSASYNLV